MNLALRHFFLGLGIVLARPLVLLLLVLVSLFMALPVALPAWMSANTHLAHVSGYPGDLPPDFLTEVPGWLLAEWDRADSGWRDLIHQGLAPALLLSSLLGLLFCAGWMHSAVRGRGQHGPSAFFLGGGSYFFPFFRTWVLGLGLVAFWTWLFWGSPGDWVMTLFLPQGDPGLATSETTARLVENGREVLYFLSLLSVELLLDVTRADLVVREARCGFWAMLRSFFTLLRAPHHVLCIVGVGWVLEALWLSASPALVSGLNAPLWVLVFLIPFGRIWMRGARWAGLALWMHSKSVSAPADPPEASPEEQEAPEEAIDDPSHWIPDAVPSEEEGQR